MGLHADKNLIWSSSTEPSPSCLCCTPQNVNTCHSTSILPNVAERWLMNFSISALGPIIFKSSTCLMIAMHSSAALCIISSSLSMLELFNPKASVTCLNFKLKHFGASLQPVPGFRQCSTSRLGSKPAKSGSALRHSRPSPVSSKLTSQ